jgi:hypothetical protein
VSRVSGRPASAPAAAVQRALLDASFPYFLSELLDPAGRPFALAPHVRAWADLIATERRLVLLAPRDHGKTTLLLAYVLWRFWRHRYASSVRVGAAPGTFEAVLFSATRDQALVLMTKFRDLLLANPNLFGEVDGKAAAGPGRGQIRWSQHAVRLTSGADLRIRAYRTSTRGLHPDLLLLDDVLSDQNSLSSHQRELTFNYFVRTLLPMNPGQLIIVGTAIHQDDLLHRLGRSRANGMTPLGFAWRRYRALDEASGTALWPGRHPVAELLGLRDFDPLMFSREYMNDPRDDAASMFPFELTQRAIDAGVGFVLGANQPPDPREYVVLGADFALSEAAGADYTAVMVVAYDPETQRRRVLDIRRVKGLDFAAQVALIRDLTARHRVSLGVVEQNGFQRWLVDELERWPETRGRIFGNTTGRAKAHPMDGIPRLKLELLAGTWVVPSGDGESLRLARRWQTELGAFGIREGRLEGVGEHDDLVISSWYVELAVRLVARELALGPMDELVTLRDLGIEPVRIGPDYDLPGAF